MYKQAESKEEKKWLIKKKKKEEKKWEYSENPAAAWK